MIIENAAISDDLNSDVFELNVLDPGLWDEYKQAVGRSATEIASIYDGSLISKISNRLNITLEEAKNAVIKIACPQYTLESLLNKHEFGNVDVLQIDCEGHDFNVIKSLNDIRPHIINFESMNLDHTQWAGWKNWAATNGYGWIQGPSDTLAIKGAHFACEY